MEQNYPFPKIQSGANAPLPHTLQIVAECDMTSALEKKLSRLARVSCRLPMIHSCILHTSVENLEYIKNIPEIKSIHVTPLISVHMDQSRRIIHANSAYEKGYTGSGIGIAVLDTGISPIADFTQPQNRIVAFRDFLYGKNKPYDDNGHGTQVIWLHSCHCHFLIKISSVCTVSFPQSLYFP